MNISKDTSHFSRYQLPFLQFVFECLLILIFSAALIPGLYLNLFFISIPLSVCILILAQLQSSPRYRMSIINVFVSIFLVYLSYNSVVGFRDDFVYVIMTSLLAATGLTISIISVISIAQEVYISHEQITKKTQTSTPSSKNPKQSKQKLPKKSKSK